ncbi:hypothetical protein EBT23_01445 [bacterium]|nr:hypothetical protein [bacterium]
MFSKPGENLLKTSPQPSKTPPKNDFWGIFGLFLGYLIQIPGRVPGVSPVNLPVNSRCIPGRNRPPNGSIS